jgi:hypothetical protein
LSRTKLLGKTNNDLDNYVIHQTAYSSVAPPPAISTSIADSGASSHFVTFDAPIINQKVKNTPLAITLANGELMYSTHKPKLNIPFLPFAAQYCHVVPKPKLGECLLLSIGQLCDPGCDVLF